MTHRTREFKGVTIPSATTTQVHSCGDTDHVHLIGFDDEDKPLCEIVVSQDIFFQMLAILLANDHDEVTING